jgi:hypothetical protein
VQVLAPSKRRMGHWWLTDLYLWMGFFVEGCSDEEEQLDFTFSEEEYEKC